MASHGTCYRLDRRIAGIKLDRAGSENGVAEPLRRGSVLEVRGTAQFFMMVEARFCNEIYAVFLQDLDEYATIVPPAADAAPLLSRSASGF